MSCKGLLLLPDAPEDPEEEAETTGDTEATTCDTKLWTAGGRDACGGLCCTGNIGKLTIRDCLAVVFFGGGRTGIAPGNTAPLATGGRMGITLGNTAPWPA